MGRRGRAEARPGAARWTNCPATARGNSLHSRDSGSTSVTAFVDPAEPTGAARKAREVTATDEHRVLGAVVGIEPARLPSTPAVAVS